MDNITNSIIFYSVALKDFEELDFKNDALAGVRACYFREELTSQQGDTIRHFEEEKYNYCYTLEQGKPMLWKVFKNRQLIQGTKYLPDDMYCICFYNNDELITKKIYFNKEHYWTKTEYFIPENGNECVCSIAPKIINGYFALLKTVYTTTGYSASPLYMVSEMPAYELCNAVAYSDKGMLYFTTEAPSNIPVNEVEVKGFTFAPHDFNLAKNLNSTFNISNLEYLNDTNGNPFDKKEPVEIFSNSSDIPVESDITDINVELETEDIVEDIILPETIALDVEDVDNIDSTEEIAVEPSKTEDTPEELNNSEETNNTDLSDILVEDEPVVEDIEEAFEVIESNDVIIEEVVETIESTEESSDEIEDNAFVVADKPESNKVIQDDDISFNYYGSLDDNGYRSGYGRTETAQGKTAYEGEYLNDMRNGFGSFYYKDGSINYVGDWKNNLRDGRGVGFRSSDSQVHVGKWKDNTPDDIGVRFDKDGNFISLNHYSMGNKDGIGISFDKNGNLVVTKWKDNNEVDSTIIIINEK